MQSKKLLTPFDIENPTKIIEGFLYPNTDAEPINSFLEIKTGKEWFHGYVVYVGIELSKNEVFAKIVDSGKKISSVEFLLDSLDDYLKQLNEYKIGDIVKIESTNNGFKLTKCKKPKINMKKLP